MDDFGLEHRSSYARQRNYNKFSLSEDNHQQRLEGGGIGNVLMLCVVIAILSKMYRCARVMCAA